MVCLYWDMFVDVYDVGFGSVMLGWVGVVGLVWWRVWCGVWVCVLLVSVVVMF